MIFISKLLGQFCYSIDCFMSAAIYKAFQRILSNIINDTLNHGQTSDPKSCMNEVTYLPLPVKLLILHLFAPIKCSVAFRQGE